VSKSLGGARHRIRPILEKCVDELLGYSMRPLFASGMLEDIAAARRLPLHDLSVNQLRLLIQNGEAVSHLLPLALDHLERDPLVEAFHFRGDLLRAVLGAEIHWFERAELKAQVRAIVERALATLAEMRPLDLKLSEELHAYLDRQRT